MGPQSKTEIAKALKIKHRDLNSCVKNLWTKGIVAVSIGDPIILCAFPFEKVLEILIIKEIEETKEIQEKRNELVSSWSLKNCKEKNHKKL